MFGFQTLTCIHNIPVIRSSTNKLQDVYAKAKDTSVLIRLPCNLVETVADKSLQIALTVANPFVKPFSGPVRVIDDFAAQKIRQIESKYPAIKTPTKDVMNSFKDSTASTIQHGKETVSNVATATVNKASDVADSVLSLVQGRDTKNSHGLIGRMFSPIGSLYDNVFEMMKSSLLWFRMLVVFFLLKLKQINDIVLHKIQQKPFLTLAQRLLIFTGIFLDYFIGRIQLDDRALADLKKAKQQTRFSQQSYPVRQSVKPESPMTNRPSTKTDSSITTRQSIKTDPTIVTRQGMKIDPPMVTRQSIKTDPSIGTRQSVFVSQQETTITRTSNGSTSQNDHYYMTDDDVYTTEPVDLVASGDIAQLHDQLKPTDVELLYSRLPTDIVCVSDNNEPLTADQQSLHAKLIGAELEYQGYRDGQ